MEGGPVAQAVAGRAVNPRAQARLGERAVERLLELAEKKDRSVNYLVVEAIPQYLKQDEKKM
jgi:predicted transcriptional regulator